METLGKLKTLTLIDEKQSNTTDDELASQTRISFPFPIEIIQDILSRLPIKPLLQSKSVSKQWLSLISNDPSFSKLHFVYSVANGRNALFISAYDTSTHLRHFLSAPLSGGHATHLMTLHNAPSTERETTEAEHLNGLVLFTSGNGFVENNFAFVINPATRNIYKLPGCVSNYTYGKVHICYFFGFDEVKNEHKVLNIRMLDLKSIRPFRPSSVEFMIFSLSDYSWRKIDVEPEDFPVDISGEHWYYGTKGSVCVNSVIHVMLQSQNVILAFDLRTEKFEIIKIPNEALPFESGTWYTRKGMDTLKLNQPLVMKVDGLLGVLCHDRVVECNEMYVWVLQDYENRVWVRKTIAFSESWVNLDGPFPSGSGNAEEILFNPKRLSRNMMSVPVYDLKTGSFKSVKYFLGHQFLRSKTVKFNHVTTYIESIVPLQTNESETS